MAGDWIKMRVDLHDDPAIIAMAAALDLPETYIVGLLHRFWSWANTQLRDGNAPGVTPTWVDRYVGVANFCAALEQVGWLIVRTDGILIPHFDRHNSKAAKQRALTTKRVQHLRNARGVTQALPEKRREEKRDLSLKKERESAATPRPSRQICERLRDLIDRWNALPEGLAPRVRSDPPAKAILRGWALVGREPELRAAFADLDALLAAIEAAEFCHGQPWFRLAWLFASNRAGEWNAVKLVEGAYRDARPTGKKPQKSIAEMLDGVELEDEP